MGEAVMNTPKIDTAAAREAHKFGVLPNLWPVIQWLEGGCDPKEAAKELRLYAERIDRGDAPVVASAAPAAVVPADDSHEQTLWLRELFTLIEKWHETRDGTPSKAGAWMALWKHAHNIGPHWRDRAHLAPAHIDADKLHRDGWISVDDRLPEVGQEVLMWVAAEVRGESDDGREVGRDVSQVAMGMCMRGQDDTTYLSCYVSPFADFEHITHWMPLPTSPDRDARHAAAELVSSAISGKSAGDAINSEQEKVNA